MLDLYIVDYLSKRNLSLSAQSLLAETGLIEGQKAKDLKVPIDARQGLLYEWWTVFWELFTAKNNDGGKPDARVYVDVSFEILAGVLRVERRMRKGRELTSARCQLVQKRS
jgi:hypothetical protein